MIRVRYSILVFLLFLLAWDARANTLSVEVIGGRTSATRRLWWRSVFEEPVRKWVGLSAGEVSVSALNEMQAATGIEFEASEQGVRRIGALGSDLDLISDARMKAYGWCFRVERGQRAEVPEVMPDQLILDQNATRLVWFYAYAEYDAMRGGWISQCVPAGD